MLAAHEEDKEDDQGDDEDNEDDENNKKNKEAEAKQTNNKTKRSKARAFDVLGFVLTYALSFESARAFFAVLR